MRGFSPSLSAGTVRAEVPLGQLAELRLAGGPPMIESDNARPNVWISVAPQQGVDMERADQRLQILVPVTSAIIFPLPFLHFKNATESAMLTLVTIPPIHAITTGFQLRGEFGDGEPAPDVLAAASAPALAAQADTNHATRQETAR